VLGHGRTTLVNQFDELICNAMDNFDVFGEFCHITVVINRPIRFFQIRCFYQFLNPVPSQNQRNLGVPNEFVFFVLAISFVYFEFLATHISKLKKTINFSNCLFWVELEIGTGDRPKELALDLLTYLTFVRSEKFFTTD
jgi:hypothetical protein